MHLPFNHAIAFAAALSALSNIGPVAAITYGAAEVENSNWAKPNTKGITSGQQAELQNIDDVYRKTLAVEESTTQRNLDQASESYRTQGDGEHVIPVYHDSKSAAEYKRMLGELDKKGKSAPATMKKLELFEDSMDRQNYRVIEKMAGIMSRFGRWDPKTQKFAHEDALLSKFRKLSRSEDLPSKLNAYREMGGLNSAKEFMNEVERSTPILIDMYKAKDKKGGFSLTKLFDFTSPEEKRAQSYGEYKKKLQAPKTPAIKRRPSIDLDKSEQSEDLSTESTASRNSLFDEFPIIDSSKDLESDGAPKAKSGSTLPPSGSSEELQALREDPKFVHMPNSVLQAYNIKNNGGFLSEIGLRYNKVSPDSMQYLLNSQRLRHQLVLEGLVPSVDKAKEAELVDGILVPTFDTYNVKRGAKLRDGVPVTKRSSEDLAQKFDSLLDRIHL